MGRPAAASPSAAPRRPLAVFHITSSRGARGPPGTAAPTRRRPLRRHGHHVAIRCCAQRAAASNDVGGDRAHQVRQEGGACPSSRAVRPAGPAIRRCRAAGHLFRVRSRSQSLAPECPGPRAQLAPPWAGSICRSSPRGFVEGGDRGRRPGGSGRSWLNEGPFAEGNHWKSGKGALGVPMRGGLLHRPQGWG